LLLTLSSLDMITQDGNTGSYALGSRVLELSAAVPKVSELREAAGPILARLALATQTTAFLSVYRMVRRSASSAFTATSRYR